MEKTENVLKKINMKIKGWCMSGEDPPAQFCVPLISKHSPVAISIAMHMHYNVCQHKGVESTYRLSLQHARVLQGKQLFKEISDDCIYCKKLRQKYVRQLMGPFSDTQLCISPIFYFCYMDMWGPLTTYCPGYEKRTRNRQQAYEVHMLVMGCAVTGAVNCQIIEKKSTDFVLDGLNRFFAEVCVPKICYPDKDGAIMKALSEGEMTIQDLQGRLHRERGLFFETCLPQGHYQHGRIERKIKQLQESLDRSNIRNSRVTATGWQTIAKAIEHEVNSVPMGFLYHQGTANPLLRVLCPNLLKNSTFTDRAPKGLFSIPNSPQDLMSKIEKTYNLWFQVWNTEYLPLVMDRPKWHLEDENLKENDIVYFKLSDSKLSADWRLGKVESVHTGRDGKVRSVQISYKIMIENDKKLYHEDFEWRHSVVERPARAVVKLMNIEDTSLLENMAKVQDLVKKILKKEEDEDVLDENKLKLEGNIQDITNDDHLNKAVNSFTNKSDDCFANYSVSKQDGTIIKWPKNIMDEEQIGLLTNAVLDGVTELIAKDADVLGRDDGKVDVLGSQGAVGLGGGEHGVRDLCRYDDNYSVFLM